MFYAKNLGSVGQWAAKLLAIKLSEWLDRAGNRTEADWFKWGRGQLADFFLRPPTLIASNFAALWHTDPKFLPKKDLNLLKKYTKNQEASSILRVDFALSKWPHFHREFSNRPGMVVRHCICYKGQYRLTNMQKSNVKVHYDKIYGICLSITP